MKILLCIFVVAALFLINCTKPDERFITFKDDLDFLEKYTDVIVLSDEKGKAQVAVVPELQGRAMTSTATGLDGPSYGWINRELIDSGQNNLHINAFGGEDRFWLGPEGGQFAIFFKKGDPFDLEHWYTPPPINEGPYKMTAKLPNSVDFVKEMKIRNYADFDFHLSLQRIIRLLTEKETLYHLGLQPLENLDWVSFESSNLITNTGDKAWVKESGLLSIWILGMFSPSPKTTVVVPFVPGPESELGAIVNTDYFGEIPEDRLRIKDGVIYFKGDGNYRSKIGISPMRCKSILGSYDGIRNVLSIVQFTLPEGAMDYVNSMWKVTEYPYGGDVANSYNDGPATPGAKPFGPFYELESSSPAAVLQSGQSTLHVHRTTHVTGDRTALDKVCLATLGVTIDQVENAWQ